MAAIPRELIGAELFGYERGAFTGAPARTAGRIGQAAGGMLFVDEIGDMLARDELVDTDMILAMLVSRTKRRSSRKTSVRR